MSDEARKVLEEAEATQNEETKQETTAVAPVVEKKPNVFVRAWNGVKSHKGVILGTVATIGAGIAGFVLGAMSSRNDDGYDYGDGGDNTTPFYGGSDETEDFSSDDESDEEIS